ncbi:Galactosylceramide sulfotransferase [Thelohanellus kitauei]|uniref:Galactosylceramide sulfotransferase n=1 Tax=Thelohanellus kitauei TaxID=669202 RepID=A0A0C2NM88_THEKT|nr:Galactosylceramide sulfotransferase [Thelohanellus kitauei]
MHLVHSMLDRKTVEQFFPRKSTFFVTILRNTTAQWVSIFRYFQIGTKVWLDTSESSMRLFISNYGNYGRNNKTPVYLGKNPNFCDMGFHDEELASDSAIESSIKVVDKMFDLVMISELWEKSLLILKNKLDLSFDDISVFNSNVQLIPDSYVPPDLDKQIREFNKADYKLYQYFYEKLMNSSKQLNQRDFSRLRKRTKFWKETCIGGRKLQVSYGTRKYLGYKAKDNIPQKYQEDCKRMIYSEIDFVKKFRTMMA